MASSNPQPPRLKNFIVFTSEFDARTSLLVQCHCLFSNTYLRYYANRYPPEASLVAVNRILRAFVMLKHFQGYTSSTSNAKLPVPEGLDLRYTSELLLFISTPNLTHLKLVTLLLDLETIKDFPRRFLRSIIFNDPEDFASIRSIIEGRGVTIPGNPALKRLAFVTGN